MTPHRAVLKETEAPVVVLDLVEGGFLLTVDRDGTYVIVRPAMLRCAEPAFLGQEPEKQHDHELGPAVPILEGTRVKGTRRLCMVAGCVYVEESAPRAPR